MNILEFTALVFGGSLIAGLLGSLTGLGGGVVLVPLLTLFFKVDIRYAIGASLVSVIATSSGAAAAYVRCRARPPYASRYAGGANKFSRHGRLMRGRTN